MALTNAQVDAFYVNALGRHATAAEDAGWVALSASESTAGIELAIATLPETVQFVDPVVRLYQGAFGRVPDVPGLHAAENYLRGGGNLLQLAQDFVASAEFAALYGSPAVTTALITAYYQHILNRDPSPAEVNAWVSSGLSAAQILIGFTESVEYKTESLTAVTNYVIAVESGANPTGPLAGPPPAPVVTITSDKDSGGVNEGSVVTFTVTGANGAGDAGKIFSYNFSGSDASAAHVAGVPLSGTVTLDSQGVAKLAASIVADNLTEGPQTLTLNVASQADTVTVNDRTMSPSKNLFRLFWRRQPMPA